MNPIILTVALVAVIGLVGSIILVIASRAFAVQEDDFSQYGLPQGIEVQSIDKNGPCGSTGLAAGDVITELDGKKTTTFSEIYAVLEQHKDGDKVKIKYYQASTGKEVEEEITLAADK